MTSSSSSLEAFLREKLEETESALQQERRERERHEKMSLKLLDEVQENLATRERRLLSEKESQIKEISKELNETKEVKAELKNKLKECRERLHEALGKLEAEKSKNSERKVMNAIENSKARSASSPQKCQSCVDLRSELKLQKVDVRLTERRMKETEERLKFVRDVMLAEEKDARTKAEKSKQELETELEKLQKKAEAEVREVKDFEQEQEKLNKLIKELKGKIERLEAVESQSRKTEKELNEVKGALTKAKTDVKDCERLRESNKALRTTCLELQDQLSDYERLSAGLEANAKALTDENKGHTKEIADLKQKLSDVYTDRSELKSSLAFVDSKLKRLTEDKLEMEKVESEWKKKFDRLSNINDEQVAAFATMKGEYERSNEKCNELDEENETLREQNASLKEELSEQLTKANSLRDSNSKLHGVMEEMLAKMSDMNDEIRSLQHRLGATASELEKKELESNVQISQLKKLVEHVNSEQHNHKKTHKSSSSTSSKKQLVLSYEEMQDHLEKERQKNQKLLDELKQVRAKAESVVSSADFPPLLRATAAVRQLTQKSVAAETAHSIPHRFQRQTNMRRPNLKCSVCLSTVSLCRTVSTCRFCGRVVHPACENAAEADCGLTGELALVLKSNRGDGENGQGVLHKGVLKVPDMAVGGLSPGRSWRSVGVQIVGSRLVLDDGSLDLDLSPESGSVFVQGSVAYDELSHTSAFDQPHVFKIGFSYGSKVRETYYFMAKTFQEKASWIEALERVSLLKNQPDPTLTLPVQQVSPTRQKAALANWDVLATFPSETNVFCALSLQTDEEKKDPVVLLGTSHGLYRAEEGSCKVAHFSKGPDSVFQMASLKHLDEVAMITGTKRRLILVKVKHLVGRDAVDEHFSYRLLEVVPSCHVFATWHYQPPMVSEKKPDTFICAADDARVSILKASGDRAIDFELCYAFSTDTPTTCITFAGNRKLLVATDKVYEIQLDGFEVREFVSQNLSMKLFSEDRLISIFKLDKDKEKGTEFLLCFQDYGLFLDSDGQRSRQKDLRWREVCGQFHLEPEKRRLWIAHSQKIVSLDIDGNKAGEMLACPGPQILKSEGVGSSVFFAERKSDSLVIKKRK